MAAQRQFDEPPAKQVPVHATLSSRAKRLGFSLLELMLALALLGGLLAVAWSLLGTFRDAETRGWKLAHQTQTIRTARRWLQQDLDLAIADTQPTTTLGPPRQPQLQLKGDTRGFSVIVLPGISPLPFVEALLNTTAGNEETKFPGNDPPLTSNSRPPSTLQGNVYIDLGEDRLSPWPHPLLRIEYELQPSAKGAAAYASGESAGMASGRAVGNDTDLQYTLVRSEFYDPNSLGIPDVNEELASDNRSPSNGTSQLPSDRELTLADLYRQTDEEDYAMGGNLLREARLHGLVAPQFRYSDGRQWMSEWNSRIQGGLPRAIAFSFDFPARSEIQRPAPARASAAPSSGDATMDQELQEEDFSSEAAEERLAETVLESQPLAEVETMDGASELFPTSNQVQVIVRLHGPDHARSPTRPATSPLEEASPLEGLQGRDFSERGNY